MTDPICVLSIVAFMTAGVGGTTKKFAFGAAYQLGYAVGNIIGPQTYRAPEAPNYYVSCRNIKECLLVWYIKLMPIFLADRVRNTLCSRS